MLCAAVVAFAAVVVLRAKASLHRLKACALVCLLLPSAPQAFAVTLLETVQVALSNNLDIASARTSLEISEYDTKISRASYLPTLSASANTAWNEFNTGNTPGPDTENTYNENGYKLSFSQSLIDLGKAYRMSQARQEYSIEKLRLQRTEQQVIADVLDAYIEVLKILASERTTRLELESAEAREKQLQKNYDRGNIAKSSLYEAQAKTFQVKNNLVNSQRDLSIALDALMTIAQQTLNPSFDVDPSQVINMLTREETEAYEQALLAQNLDILIARSTQQKSNSVIREKRSAFAPSLSANINHNVTDSNNSSSNIAPANGDTESTVYSLDLSVPIFSGGENYYQLSKAKSEVRKAQIDLDNAVSTAQKDLAKTIYNINANAESTLNQKRIITANAASYRGLKKAYDTGTRTLSDVLSAEKLLFDSIRTYFSTYYSYLSNLAQLNRLQATLNVETIAEVSASMTPIKTSSNDILAPFGLNVSGRN
jgi:outer membrane protein TolC